MFMRKGQVISVRIPEDLAKKFNEIAKFLPMNKTDFITECIKKLVNDNDFLMHYYPETDDLLRIIKKEIKKVRKTHLQVENGFIRDINELAIFSLCDFLFSSSKEYWQTMKDVLANLKKEWKIEIGQGEELFQEFKGDFLFDMEDISLMILPKEMFVPAEDLVEDIKWSDSLEIKKLLLLLAAQQFIKKYNLDEIISKIIDEENKSKKEKHILIIDAEGNFRRGKDFLYNPVYLELSDK